MGYKPKIKGRKLTFSDDDDLAGLEVIVRNPSIGQLMELDGIGDIGDKPSKADLEAIFRAFASLLKSWNVEAEDGTPVPCTYEGVLSQDPDFMFSIIGALKTEVTAPDPTLPAGSGSTPAGQERDLEMPMEVPPGPAKLSRVS